MSGNRLYTVGLMCVEHSLKRLGRKNNTESLRRIGSEVMEDIKESRRRGKHKI